MRRFTGWCVALIAAVAVGAYLTTTVATDRFAWMQLGWWLPRLPFAVACVLLAGLAAWLSRPSTRGRRAWTAIAALLLVFVALDIDRDFGFPRARPAGGVRLVHWNTAWTSENDAGEALAALLALDAHLVVLSDAGHLLNNGGLAQADYVVRFTATREARASTRVVAFTLAP